MSFHLGLRQNHPKQSTPSKTATRDPSVARCMDGFKWGDGSYSPFWHTFRFLSLEKVKWSPTKIRRMIFEYILFWGIGWSYIKFRPPTSNRLGRPKQCQDGPMSSIGRAYFNMLTWGGGQMSPQSAESPPRSTRFVICVWDFSLCVPLQWFTFFQVGPAVKFY